MLLGIVVKSKAPSETSNILKLIEAFTVEFSIDSSEVALLTAISKSVEIIVDKTNSCD